MATGVADNMLITTYLSMKAPVFIAPAMDLDMYAHPTTQQNLSTLRSFGNLIIEPQTGFLASGLEGKGRMEDPEKIVDFIDDYFEEKDLAGKHVLITAGPTYEKIDPVRFIGNYSSGKMGFALAEECARRGADVTLVTGPVSLKTKHANIHRIDIESCLQMRDAAIDAFQHADAAILCAAVADFRPAEIAEQKIKRVGENLDIHLLPNPDIAAELGGMKKDKQLLIGFALETNDEQHNAEKKLEKKNLDFIVLNSLRNNGTCFQSDENQISIISKDGKKDYEKKKKNLVARDIINELKRRLLVLLLVFGFTLGTNLHAQELFAKININHQQIQGTDASVFDNLQQTLEQFVNEKQWTALQFQQNERISCTFNITVTKYDASANRFTCTALIQANRPVYNSAYTTTVYNNRDKNFDFDFAQFDQLNYNEEYIDNQLTALIAYYAYLIIGLDLDTFSPMGGTDVLVRCMNLVNNAQNLDFSGWKSFEDSRNRFAIINDYLDEAMKPFRQLQYDYYRTGLDEMAQNAERGRANITTALESGLKQAHQDKPLSLLPQIWTDYKKDELANIYKGKGTQKEKEKVYDILFGLNASQSNSWNKIKQ
jgi:phosphopantothenoylcysteine decarboxylase/phosphopantothenate--cysteine ligase